MAAARRASLISLPPVDEAALDPRQKWDRRYADLAATDRRDPSPFVASCLARLPHHGRALDIAAGAGRHSLALARHGLRVHAIDISWQGLTLARQRVLAAQPPLPPGQVQFLVADVERPWLPPGPYDVALVSYFLHRPLFPLIKGCLRPGGWLLYETFTVQQLLASPHRHSTRRDYWLQPDELRLAFSDFELLVYDETSHDGRATARLLARKPAHQPEQDTR